MPTTTRRPTTAARVLVYGLFLFIAAVTLWVPLYNRRDPALGGVPFFYWFQMAWILVSAAATALAYKLGL